MPAIKHSALLVRIPGVICAFPLETVVETMRPLPINPLAGSADFVRGVAIVRGSPTPVIDLGALFGGGSQDGKRFLVLRSGERKLAALVEEVIGVTELDDSALGELPPLLHGMRSDVVEQIGRLDTELVVTFRTGRLVPEEVWDAVANARTSNRK